jgi:8-oxo-dGTP pyrophosphatase MutT (NUDIX family)
MARDPIPTWFFVLVVVRLGRRYLLVRERKHGQLWYLPAGRVEPGETFVQAAQRETLEEASIPIVIEGVLRVEHSPQPDGTARVRVIFIAHPADDTPPKIHADQESLGAGWFTLDELETLPLRGDEVREIFRYVNQSPSIYPVGLITYEGAAFAQRL